MKELVEAIAKKPSWIIPTKSRSAQPLTPEPD